MRYVEAMESLDEVGSVVGKWKIVLLSVREIN